MNEGGDNIITVFNNENVPNFYDQYSFSFNKNDVEISPINSLNSIVIFPKKFNSENIYFLFWNVKQKDGKDYVKYVFKEIIIIFI